MVSKKFRALIILCFIIEVLQIVLSILLAPIVPNFRPLMLGVLGVAFIITGVIATIIELKRKE